MKKLIALLLASSLSGCGPHPGPGGVPPPTSTLPDYYAIFNGGDLGCCIVRDVFHHPPQALAKGRSLIGEIPVWTGQDNALDMLVTSPALENTPVDAAGNPETLSMGTVSTGHNCGPGTAFTVSATFQKPYDSACTSKAWAMGVVARTGGAPDTPDLKRLQFTFSVKACHAQLRVREIIGPMDADLRLATINQDVSDADYDAIVKSGQPFTLKLFVDRKTNSGTATMITGTETLAALTFNMTYFTADPASEPLTTVGAALANCCNPGETRSVEVSDFKLWGPLDWRMPQTTPYIRKPIPRADPSRYRTFLPHV